MPDNKPILVRDPFHPNEHRSGDFYRIVRDIEEERYGSLRTKYAELVGQLPDEGPQDKSAESEVLSYANLCAEGVLPGNKDPQFSRWKKSGAKWPFHQKDAIKLLHFFWTHTYWSAAEWHRRKAHTDPDEYFDSLVHKMRCERSTRENLELAVPGLYQVWSRSVVLRGRYVFGLFAAYTDGHALKTVEIHKLPRLTDADGIVLQPALEETAFGYMVKKSQQIIVHAFDSITRAFKFTAITNTYRGTGDTGQYTAMKSIDFELIGNKHWCRDKVFLRHGSIEDLLATVQTSEELPERLQFTELSNLDLRVLHAMRSLPLFSRLSLVEQDSVPVFVDMQLNPLE